MKIVTVNVPESDIDAMKKLVGRNGLYPSRSELIRVAVRSFLIKRLEEAKNLLKNKPEMPNLEDKNTIFIPIESKNENNEIIRELRNVKVIKRLDDYVRPQ